MDAQTTAAVMPLRAAQYVRMSTEHQRYSPENQKHAIGAYAALRGYEIVRTYADEGKSGLTVDARLGLQQLIRDVQAGAADYSAILVYDVSRWGRFQDADESAYYEFICRRAGISVVYCAEQFENDGSPMATIVKGIKRAMAGEYSRELSVKVFAAQGRAAGLGYWPGGPVGYALRRLLTDENGDTKEVMALGQRKSLRSDRVIVCLGPAHEVDTVRRIFAMFVDERKNEGAIAAILNSERSPNEFGRPWYWGGIHQIVTNEKYLGNLVWNKRRRKLKAPITSNAPDAWIRVNGAFPAIVRHDVFASARAIIESRRARRSNDELLEGLRALWTQYGYLSSLIIDAAGSIPTASVYHKRFGSLIEAYRLVGYHTSRREITQAVRRMRPAIVAEIICGIENEGGQISRDPKTDLLTINGEFTVAVAIARCLPTRAGSPRWLIEVSKSNRADITLIVRIDGSNAAPLDYYLLPRSAILSQKIRLTAANALSLEVFRFDTLSFFFAMTARAPLREVA
jgi:DNA invertase Pin-like site-specific DNA recombinase